MTETTQPGRVIRSRAVDPDDLEGGLTVSPADLGERLYEHFCAALRNHGPPVATGAFGADMALALVNDGPVTIWLDTEA